MEKISLSKNELIQIIDKEFNHYQKNEYKYKQQFNDINNFVKLDSFIKFIDNNFNDKEKLSLSVFAKLYQDNHNKQLLPIYLKIQNALILIANNLINELMLKNIKVVYYDSLKTYFIICIFYKNKIDEVTSIIYETENKEEANKLVDLIINFYKVKIDFFFENFLSFNLLNNSDIRNFINTYKLDNESYYVNIFKFDHNKFIHNQLDIKREK